MSFDDLYITPHALSRCQEVWAGIGVRGVRRMLDTSFELDPPTAASFLGRRLEDVRDTYRMSADFRGIFVLAQHEDGWRCIPTFIRMGAHQQRVAARLWPERVAA